MWLFYQEKPVWSSHAWCRPCRSPSVGPLVYQLQSWILMFERWWCFPLASVSFGPPIQNQQKSCLLSEVGCLLTCDVAVAHQCYQMKFRTRWLFRKDSDLVLWGVGACSDHGAKEGTETYPEWWFWCAICSKQSLAIFPSPSPLVAMGECRHVIFWQ